MAAAMMLAIIGSISSEIAPALLGPLVSGEHPWAPAVLVGLAAGCFAAATTRILLRVLAGAIGVAMSFPQR